jgi:hypothetical protein
MIARVKRAGRVSHAIKQGFRGFAGRAVRVNKRQALASLSATLQITVYIS